MTIATAPYLEQRFKQVATQSRDPKSPCMPQPKSRSMIAIAFVLPVVFANCRNSCLRSSI